MKTAIQERTASLKTKIELALAFLERHNKNLSALTAEKLKSSSDSVDREIFAAFCSDPDWKEKITAMAANKIPTRWDFTPLPSSIPIEDLIRKINERPKGKEIPGKKQKTYGAPSDQWNFQYPVSYFITLIPYYTGANQFVTSQALAIINDQLTTQPDSLNSNQIPFNYQTPMADAIMGNFDTANPNDQVLFQTNNSVELDEIAISSIEEYKTLYTGTTSYFTKSQAVDILKIPGKEQVVTVLLSGTQIGLDVYAFNNGQKVEWGTSQLFDHGINYSNVMAFNIAVSEVLPDNTIEVLAIVTKSDNPQTVMGCRVQTNLIRMVIDVSSKTFRLAVNQPLVNFQTSMYMMILPMEQKIYRSNGFVYLNYLSDSNTLTLASYKLNGAAYSQVWKNDYAISLPGYWFTYQPPLLYQNGNVFYFVHIFQNGNDNWPFYIEIYTQQTDGTLSKSKTIEFSNSNLNPIGNYWGGIYAQGALYLLQTTMVNGGGTSLIPYNFFYQVDEVNNKVVTLSSTQTSAGGCGEPILVLSDYDIEAQPPVITSLTENLQAIAILDSPPISTLIDYSGGANYPSLTYLFEQQQSSTKNVETKTDRTQSDDLTAGLKIFGVSIGQEIDKSITNSADNSHQSEYQLTQDTQITSQVQDMTVFLGMTFDIYEYPLTIKGIPNGCFLFLVPTSSPHLIINTGQLMLRKTSHQIGNLLSYPTEPPGDVSQLLYTNEFNINANEDFISTLTYSDLQTTSSSTTTTTTVSSSISLGIEFPIIKNVAASISEKLKGSYTNSQINTSSFTIENSFELKIQINKLLDQDAGKYFTIEPYFYIDNANVLRCAYRVDVPSGGSTDPTFWKKYYQYPDFGMVMPFHTDNFKTDSKYLLSFDIQTEPSALEQDLKELKISVTVHNWSLVSGTNVVVGFYYMKEFKNNPDKSELIEIGRQTIDMILPRGSQVASIVWENPYLIQPIDAVPIYVVIDPDNQIQEMSKDFNFAQMNYPITSLSAEAGIEQFLPENSYVEKDSGKG